MAALAFLGAASRASAQGRITIAVGDGTPLRIQQGTSIAVPFTVDMSAAAGANLAALTATLQWGSGQLLLDSVKAGAFGTLSSNTAAAEGGVAVVSAFSAVGATSSTTLGTLYFRTFETAGGTRVTLTPFVAGDELGASVLGLIRTRGLDVCVALPGRWGDANGDNGVDILDAQQIARFSIGLSVLNASAVRGEGDVNADGNVDIVDAQQIARYSVDDPAVPRVNAPTLVVPEASAITTPAERSSVRVGGRVQVTASPVDTSGVPLGGCAPITWTSSDTTKATVDQDGIVTGIAVGVPTITATAGGVTARVAMNVGVGAVPASMTIVQGDLQYRRSGVYGVRPQVRVADSLGRAVPGASVTFTSAAGGIVTPVGGAAKPLVVAVTDSSGVAEVDSWSGGGITESGQVTADGTVLRTIERVTASLPGLPSVTFTGRSLETEVGASICLLTTAGSTYCHGEYVGRNLYEGVVDSTLGGVPVLVPNGVPMASLSPAFYGEYSCGVAQTGAGFCWGWNHAGQLGDGTQTRSAGMRPVSGGFSFRKIASGHTHTCGITTFGKAYCWGLDQYGELGKGTMGGIATTPSPVSGNLIFADIATTDHSTCGVTTDGQTWCWGSAAFVDSAGSRNSVPRLITSLPALSRVALGSTAACGIASTGDVHCWGTGGPALGEGASQDRYSSYSSPSLPAPARDIWGSEDSFCASTTDGGLFCWGGNANIDIAGVGDAFPHSVPALVGYVNASRAQKQVFGFCYQTQNNQPFCFGQYAIGDGYPFGGASRPPRFSPVPVIWVEGSPSAAASMTVVTGANQSAAAGVAVSVPPSVLVRDYAGSPVTGTVVTFSVTSGSGSIVGGVVTTDASGIATLGSWTLGSLGPNTLTASAGSANVVVRATATAAPSFMQVISGDGQVQTGASSAGPVRNGQFIAPVQVEVYDASENPIRNVAVTFSIASGGGSFLGQSSLSVLTDSAGIASTFWTAGLPPGLQTATATVSGLSPKTITGISTTGVTLGSRCALGSGGKAYCWGDNSHGQIGDGTFTRRTTPTVVGGGLSFTSLASENADHACGIATSGQLYCWGANNFGQLGDGSGVDQTAPVLVADGTTFTAAAVSSYNTCGIRTDNSLMCWGWSGYDLFNDAQLGLIHSPTVIGGFEYTPTGIALGPNNACLLDGSSRKHCWGLGTSGQIGDGTFQSRSAPSADGDVRAYSKISVGVSHVCALESSSTVYCWGANVGGQLGNGSFSRTATPTAVLGDISFTSISASNSNHTCATASDGTAYCWGSNSSTDQLGDGTGLIQTAPTRVLSDVTFQSIVTGNGSTCGQTSSGQPYCWGSNTQGQLGDGTTTTRDIPVAVRWPEGLTGVPVSLAINSGNGQSVPVDSPVVPPSVIVKDYAGTPLIGTPVTFTVTSGGSSVTTATVTTNAFGIATVGSWILGPTPGTNTLTVTAPGLPTVVFTATGS